MKQMWYESVTWVSNSWPSRVGWMLISYSFSDKLYRKISFHIFSDFPNYFFVWKMWLLKNLAVVKVEVKVIEVCELNLDKEVVVVFQVGTAEVSNPTGFVRFLRRNCNFPSWDPNLMMLRAECDSVILDAWLSNCPKDRNLLLPKVTCKIGFSVFQHHPDLCSILRSSIWNCQSSVLGGPSTEPAARLTPEGSATISHLA